MQLHPKQHPLIIRLDLVTANPLLFDDTKLAINLPRAGIGGDPCIIDGFFRYDPHY